MKCEIAKDLAPLYKDKLTSEVTNTEIENHLSECDNCTAYYNGVSSDTFVIEDIANTDNDINGVTMLKKVRKKHIMTIVTIIVLAVIAAVGAFCFLFVGTLANSDDVEITYVLEPSENGDISLSAEFELTNGKVLNMFASHFNKKIFARQAHAIPFDDLGESPNKFSLGFYLRKNNDGVYEIYTHYTQNVIFSDKTITIDAKEIADELGIEYVVYDLVQ